MTLTGTDLLASPTPLPSNPYLYAEDVSHLNGQLFDSDSIPKATVGQQESEAELEQYLLNWSDLPLEVPFVFPDMTTQCLYGSLDAILISEGPRMLYLKGFVTEAERNHLMAISEPVYDQSGVYNMEDNTPKTDSDFRRSESGSPPRDEVVKCIEQRARLVQPWRPGMGLEAVTVQRYSPGGFFKQHWDSFQTAPGPDRKSTINVFLDGNCTGGGTHFPDLPLPNDPTLCDILDCESGLEGTVFRPIAGNAIFWENVRPDGTNYDEMLHAGLPVIEGTKVGMNMWTWGFPDVV
ncbi:hypothetical protein BDV25DRAFT_144367 [Aspergillus avenaceus]|uniref:Prolyl 4-hydroxylase alpha subunit domain-containing protein n=1 Tax=Aspergillus avenaceus TaxID=36643 RepID=A0A5N6THF2_ASPAV|nr:hypothetical protein BDV25DRAFT_144367 [Aspergillus avenaceus]